MYIYIHMWFVCAAERPLLPARLLQRPGQLLQGPLLGRHYLSDATCPMQPRLSYVFFVVSRIAILRQVIRHF